MNSVLDTLVFQWRDRQRSLRVLLWFFLLSFCLHALALYLFQVSYPTGLTVAPPPVQASLLTPAVPEYRKLIRWIDAGDPALVVSPPETRPPGMLDLPYRPSYSAVRSLPKQAPEPEEPLRFPAAFNLSALSQPGTGHDAIRVAAPAQTSPARFAETKSSVRFSGALLSRGIREGAAVNPSAKSSIPLKPARFFAGVNGLGEVRYVFLEESSGDKNLDQWAEHHLSRVRFAAAGNGIEWGPVVYSWGDDACSARH